MNYTIDSKGNSLLERMTPSELLQCLPSLALEYDQFEAVNQLVREQFLNCSKLKYHIDIIVQPNFSRASHHIAMSNVDNKGGIDKCLICPLYACSVTVGDIEGKK